MEEIQKAEPEDWIDSKELLGLVLEYAAAFCRDNTLVESKEKRFKDYLCKKRGEDMKRALDFGVVSGYAESDNEWRDFDTNKLNRIMEEFKKRRKE